MWLSVSFMYSYCCNKVGRTSRNTFAVLNPEIKTWGSRWKCNTLMSQSSGHQKYVGNREKKKTDLKCAESETGLWKLPPINGYANL